MTTELVDIRPTLEDFPIVEDYYNCLLDCTKNPMEFLAVKHRLTVKDIKKVVEKETNKKFLSKKVDNYFKLADFERIRVMEELKALAYTNMSDLMDFDGETLTYKDWKTLPQSVLSAVASVKQIKNNRDDVTTEIKVHNKMDALKTLASILKMQDNTLKVEGVVEHKHRLFDNAIPGSKILDAEFKELQDSPVDVIPSVPSSPEDSQDSSTEANLVQSTFQPLTHPPRKKPNRRKK